MARFRSTKTPKTKSTTPVRKYEDLRLAAKRANQAMVRLERLGISSPAYEYAQAMLEMLGKQKSGDRGRRFSETGRATYNEYEMLMSRINRFLGMSTRTESGAKRWVNKVWQGALDSNKIDINGNVITRAQWLDFWKAMPADQKDRIFGSEITVDILKTAMLKNGERKAEQRLLPEEIAYAIQGSTNVKEAYRRLGITQTDVNNVRELGRLKPNDTSEGKNP